MLKTLQRFKSVNTVLQQVKPLLQQKIKCNCRQITQTAAEKENAEKSDEQVKNRNPFAAQIKENRPATEHLNDAERQRRLKVLQLEVDIAHQEGKRVPSLDFFRDQHWEQVLRLETKSARSKYYSYLWQIEVKKESEARKKLERAASVLQRRELERRDNEENNHIIYGLAHTTMFLRIYDSTINHWQNNRLTRAMQFAPKVVLDCSYDNYMTRREALNASKQLMLCFAENRLHDDPLDLHFCNVDPNSICTQSLQRFIPTMYNPEFPMNVHKKSYTELFPRERLVYLTPHCRHDLETYDPDDVYIVGAMVDTVNNDPISLAKAKKLGLRMARLPLDRYLQWGAGSGKSLTINQMVKILLDLSTTRDWSKALAHVPRRKIIDIDEQRLQEHKWTSKRASQLNVRMDRIMKDDVKSEEPRKVRSHTQDLQFNLETWGAKKKTKNPT